jgi:superfamily II DNA or RNA helicase
MVYKLRDYQQTALKEVDSKFKKTNKVVLSICPSGGKTFTALQYAKQNKGRTLVLAHGTDILRTQWLDRAKEYGIKATDKINSKIVVNLPQSVYRRTDLEQVDLLIIDEAHEFYFAKGKKKKGTTFGMLQSIIKKVKPKKILFLTGTPSKFIKNGYETVIIAAQSLIEQGFISDVYFGLASKMFVIYFSV